MTPLENTLKRAEQRDDHSPAQFFAACDALDEHQWSHQTVSIANADLLRRLLEPPTDLNLAPAATGERRP